MTQAAFDFATERAPAAPPAEALEWVTGELPDRSGIRVYIVLIRAEGDPERTPRKKGKPDMRAEWRRELAKKPVEEIAAAILLHMADGAARTMNRIGVEMLDKTADVLPDSFEDALWSLVSKGLLEFTMQAPVLFRKASAGAAAP